MLKRLKFIVVLLVIIVLCGVVYAQDEPSETSEENIMKLIKKGNWSQIVQLGEPAYDPLVKIFKETDNKSIRFSVVRNLGKINADRAIDFIIAALEDEGEEAKIRFEAASVLTKIGDTRVVVPLLNTLETKYFTSKGQIEKIVKKLGALGDPRAKDILVNILVSNLDETPGALRASLKVVNKALNNIDSKWKSDSAYTDILDKYIQDLESEDNSDRTKAVAKLEILGDAEAVAPLIAIVENDDEKNNFRTAVIKALGGIGGAEAEEKLISMAEEEVEETGLIELRKEAVLALGALKTPGASKALLNLLVDKQVRAGVIRALGVSKTTLAISPLIKMLRSKDRNNANEALIKITGEDFDKNFKKWHEWWTENKEEFLKKRGGADEDKGKEQGKTVAAESKETKKESAVDPEKIAELIKAKKWDKLVKIGKPAIAPLSKLLKSKDKWDRGAAAKALGNIGDVSALKALIIRLKKDKDYGVKKKIAAAL